MPYYHTRNAETGKHHKGPDGGIWIHYEDTCNVHRFEGRYRKAMRFDPRTSDIQIYFAPSAKGLVAICYETQGFMTFWVQIDPEYAAWQRLDWPAHFENDWDQQKVEDAVVCFLDAAAIELAGQMAARGDAAPDS